MSDWQKDKKDSPPVKTGQTDRTRLIAVKGGRKPPDDDFNPDYASPIPRPAELFGQWIKKLLENNGQYLSGIKHIMPRGYDIVSSAATMSLPDGRAIGAELRFGKSTDKEAKTYRTIYFGKADATDASPTVVYEGFKELGRRSLYFPTNVPEIIGKFKSLPPDKRLMIVWCEGEKTRRAVAEKLKSPEAVKILNEQNFVAVSTATLGGLAGVEKTNYELVPPPSSLGKHAIIGDNEKRVEEEKEAIFRDGEALHAAAVILEPEERYRRAKFHPSACHHVILMDNDRAGRTEADKLADILLKKHNVSKADISKIDAPRGAPVGWDDADDLPNGISAEQRIRDILIISQKNSPWDMTDEKFPMPDAFSLDNRRRALAMTPFANSFYDYAEDSLTCYDLDGCAYGGLSDIWLPLADNCIKQMGLAPTCYNVAKFEELMRFDAVAVKRDSIQEEMLSSIDAGRGLMTDENNPENLFIRMFQMPDTPYIRAAGKAIIRDMVALALIPAFAGQSVNPQLLYVFYGKEERGKSTAASVLAGNPPGKTSVFINPENEAERLIKPDRYTSDIDVSDLESKDSGFGSKGLMNKLRGKTVLEFADKDLSYKTSQGRAGILKNFVNMSRVSHRPLFADATKTYNLRCVRIFTTNHRDILTDDLGSRRWVIIDLDKSAAPDKAALAASLKAAGREPTQDEELILDGKNPGLNWVHANLPAMLAHAYEDGDWRKPLMAYPALEDSRADIAENYKKFENHDRVLEGELERFMVPGAFVRQYSVALKAIDMKISEKAVKNSMKNLGFANPLKKLNGKGIRVWAWGADLPKSEFIYSKRTRHADEEWKWASEAPKDILPIDEVNIEF